MILDPEASVYDAGMNGACNQPTDEQGDSRSWKTNKKVILFFPPPLGSSQFQILPGHGEILIRVNPKVPICYSYKL